MPRQPSSVFALAGRVGGFRRAALHDGEAMTRTARETFAASFERGHHCRVCPATELPADLLPGERRRRADALRRAHYSAVALASARARADRKGTRPQNEAATAGTVTGLEVRDAARNLGP